MLSTSFVGVLVIAVSASAVSIQEEILARSACREAIRIQDDYAAGFIKLAVQDCASGCDGCVNLDAPQNAGLDKYIRALREVYNKKNIYEYMSRADFWALCGAEGVQVTRENADPLTPIPHVRVTYGRENCHPDNPYSGEETALLNPHSGLQDVLDFYQKVYKLNEKEVVALMGMNSVGKERPHETGFEGSRTSNPDALDNDYYYDLLELENLEWEQVNKRTPEEPRYQWVHQASQLGCMLNTDISLVYNIQPNADGKVEEELSEVQRSPTADHVLLYATDDDLWIKDFVAAFGKVLENYEELDTNYNEDDGSIPYRVGRKHRQGGRHSQEEEEEEEEEEKKPKIAVRTIGRGDSNYPGFTPQGGNFYPPSGYGNYPSHSQGGYYPRIGRRSKIPPNGQQHPYPRPPPPPRHRPGGSPSGHVHHQSSQQSNVNLPEEAQKLKEVVARVLEERRLF